MAMDQEANASASQPEYPDPGRPDYCARCGSRMHEEERGGRLRPVCPRCGWVYYARNATGAALLLERDGKILLVRRAHEPFQGWWMLPSGFVEYGERAEETVVREAEEEVGLRVTLDGLFGVYFGADDPRNVAHLIVYRVRGEGEPRPGDDAEAVAFFGPDDLPSQIAFAGQRAAIRDWVRRQREPASTRAAAQALFAALGRGDQERMGLLVADDVRYEPRGERPDFLRPALGRDTYLALAAERATRARAPLEVLRIVAHGDRASVEWRCAWEQAGLVVGYQGVALLEFREGRLARHDDYLTRASADGEPLSPR